MKAAAIAITLLSLACLGQNLLAAEPAALAFDTYGGYFVSNKFEPDAASSFLAIADQAAFDKTFGAAFVMRDKSHRLAKDAFKTRIVLAAVKRGSDLWKFNVTAATASDGTVDLKYTTTATKSGTAKFACPLIVSVPKGSYKAVRFWENGKLVKEIELPATGASH